MSAARKFTDERLDRMAQEYQRLQYRYSTSRLGDERGDRAYAKIEQMVERLEATGQLNDFLDRIR